MTETDQSVLRFDQADLPDTGEYDTVLNGVNFEIRKGDLVMVQAQEHRRKIPLADAASGLVDAEKGKVLFKNEDWVTMGVALQTKCRGTIGRIFFGTAWVSNLDIDENITLAVRHHTGTPFSQLKKEAITLAEQFGMEGIPEKRPAWVSRGERQVLQWVRALLGKPELLVLEFPVEGLTAKEVETCMMLTGKERERGCGILWITFGDRAWDHGSLNPTRKFKMDGRQLKEVNGRD